MEIKVLGSGCANCKKVLENVNHAVSDLNLNADILYITDYVEIVKTGLLKTPGLMVDGKIVSAGRVPTLEETKQIIQKYI